MAKEFDKSLNEISKIMDKLIVLDWFDYHYIESRAECKRLLIKAEIDYPITIEQLYYACVEIMKYSTKKESLIVHIKLFCELSYVGMPLTEASVALRKVLLKQGKIKPSDINISMDDYLDCINALKEK